MTLPSSPLAVAVEATAAEMLARATCVLFDFDGPLCDLFARFRAPKVAAKLLAHLERQEMSAGLGTRLGTGREDDPHKVLRVFAASGADARQVAALGAELTELEVIAARHGRITPYAADFVKALVRSDRAVAVVTNNAAAAARKFLRGGPMGTAFSDRIFGRDDDHPSRMKPDPDCLIRAMKTLGRIPSECVMIGDSPADVVAARDAGVSFIGFATNDRKARILRDVDEHVVLVSSHKPLLGALEPSPTGA